MFITIRNTIFNEPLRIAEVGLTEEFFDKYLAKHLSTEDLENRLKRWQDNRFRDKKYIPDPKAEFLGRCRQKGELVDSELIPNADEVWKAMIDKRYIRPDFDWNEALKSIMDAIAPFIGREYLRYCAKNGRPNTHFNLCDYISNGYDPVDMYISSHYDRLHSPVVIDCETLKTEIGKWLPSSQREMLEWLRGLKGFTGECDFDTHTITVEAHGSLEMHGSSNPGECMNGSSRSKLRMSSQDMDTLDCLCKNLCQLIDTVEFHQILERTVS